MSATISISQDDVMTALRSFIIGLVAGIEVVQGLPNGVAMPVNPFIQMTPLFWNRIATNSTVYDDVGALTGTQDSEAHIEWVVQIDCYGPLGNDWSVILTTMFRDEYGVTALGPDVTPLYADDAKQLPIVDGEENFEQRWMITAHLQYNPVVAIPMEFFDGVDITLINVDTLT